jgi:predicted DNA-binding antitoxin AbrB/MazE fold protein
MPTMSQVEAIYRHGVFEPLDRVDLVEDQRFRLHFEPTNGSAPQTWLNHVRQLQAAVIQRQGYLPDSSADIAADRMR